MADEKQGRSVYLVRHQAAGILTSHIFAAPPTDAQMAPMKAECERLHGVAHPKTGEPYWATVVEVPLLAGEAPAFPKRDDGAGKANIAGTPRMQVSGVGTVVNPGDKG